MALQANLLAAADHSDDDAFQQQSGDRLALLLGRGLGPPKGGKILGQILDGGQFGRARRLGPVALKALVVGRQTRLLAERATFRMSWVAWSVCIAQLCRKTCGDTFFPMIEGRMAAAVSTCLAKDILEPAGHRPAGAVEEQRSIQALRTDGEPSSDRGGCPRACGGLERPSRPGSRPGTA